MSQEQINSYLIKKVQTLEGQVEALSEVIHALIDALPDPDMKTLDEACEEHKRLMSIVAGQAVLDEKRRLGKLLWGGS